MRAGFEYFKTFEQDAKDFAAFSATKLEMPFLVLTGEKASGTFLIDQTRLVATNVTGTVVKGEGSLADGGSDWPGYSGDRRVPQMRPTLDVNEVNGVSQAGLKTR